MKLSEIITLIGAGYSKEEIAALEAAETGTAPAPKQQPAPKPQPTTQPQPAPIPEPKPTEPEPTEPPTSEAATQIRQAVNDFTKALQSFNVSNARQPATPTPQDSATEILTKFCNM